MAKPEHVSKILVRVLAGIEERAKKADSEAKNTDRYAGMAEQKKLQERKN